MSKIKYTIADKLQTLETYLDSIQLHKVVKENKTLYQRVLAALGITRQLQHIFKQRNYSLYGWIIEHRTPMAKLQRFHWRKYVKLRNQTNLEGSKILTKELIESIAARSKGR